MVEETGDVAVMHCVDAIEIPLWFCRSCLWIILMVATEEVEIEEICDTLTIRIDIEEGGPPFDRILLLELLLLLQ